MSADSGVPKARPFWRRPLPLVAGGLIFAVLGVLLMLGVENVREAAERSDCSLSQIGLALHFYEDTYKRMPPAALCGKDGRPLLSWRVLILPYIEQDELYKEFKLDEPWDGPNNIRLLERMPRTYQLPGRKAKLVPPHHTTIHVFVGRGTPFEDTELRLDRDFPDGRSNTFLIVEAGPPVPWTKPEEIPFDPDGPVPELEGVFKDGFRVVMADGSRRWVKKGTEPWAIRAAITRNGGEPAGFD
jgi:hypothetical protein